MKLDKSVCAVMASAALALSSMSFILCPTVHAADSAHTPSEASKTAMSIETEGDGDGDELLEHWGDARYSREERFQLAGMTVLLTLAGAGAARRRRTLRRFYTHG